MDTTGAGDAFLAGFCYGLYHGKSAESILYGNLTGATSVTQVGCLTNFRRGRVAAKAEEYAGLIG